MKIVGEIPTDRKDELRAAMLRTDYNIVTAYMGTARKVPYAVMLVQAVAILRGGWTLTNHGNGAFTFTDTPTGRTCTFTPTPRTSHTNPYNAPDFIGSDSDPHWCHVCHCWDLGLVETEDSSAYTHTDH